MHNEWLLILASLSDIFLVFTAARFGTKRLYGTIAINLILISIFGAKLVTLFGYTTNVGNIFYACVFLATYFILERHDKKDAFRTIWFGIICLTFFIVLSQLAVHFTSAVPGDSLDAATRTVFKLSIRIALASALSYMFAQYVNILIYSWIKSKTGERFLWLRANVANICGQIVDCSLFFTIGFVDLPGNALVQAILAGLVIRTLVVVIGTPFIYIDRYVLARK